MTTTDMAADTTVGRIRLPGFPVDLPDEVVRAIAASNDHWPQVRIMERAGVIGQRPHR